MDDALFVSGLERRRNLERDAKGFVGREAGPARRAARGRARNPVGERGALDELEHQRMRRTGPRRIGGRDVFEAIDVTDVLVIERREHLRLAPEPGKPVRIGCPCVRQDFQRDVAIEFRVPGAVDLTHAARAEGGDDFVRTKPGSWAKRHGNELWNAGIIARSHPCRVVHAAGHTEA